MTSTKTQNIKAPTRMAQWFFNHGLKYAKAARAINGPRVTQTASRPWTRQDIQSIAQGIVPTDTEKVAIVKGLHALGYKCLPGDLW